MPENIALDDFYESPKAHGFRLFVIGVVLLVLGFITAFPFRESIENAIITGLNANRACPIQYQSMDLSLLFPKVKLTKPNVSGLCFGNPRKSLDLKSATVSLGLPSFLPFGIKMNINLVGQGSDINIYPLIGFSRYVRIEDSLIHSRTLNTVIGQGELLGGKFNLNSLVKLEGNKMNEGTFKLSSKDFGVRQTKLSAVPFTIPNIRIGKVNVEAELEGKTVTVSRIEIGEPGSSIYAKLKGTMKIGKFGKKIIDINLVGELGFSEDLVGEGGELSMLNLLWAWDKQPKQGGLVKVQFVGPPQRAFLKPQFLN